MRQTPKFLVILISLLALGLGCAGKTGPIDFITIHLYHTNDIHAHLTPNSEGRGGLAYLASVLKLVRAREPEALIVDGGDFYKKGSLPAQNSQDLALADIMAQISYYDARAVGNNEVKLGISKLVEWSKSKERAPLLSANLVDKERKPLFAPFTIIKKQGLKIGLIGMTPNMPYDANIQPDLKTDPRAPYITESFVEGVLPVIKKVRPQVDILILLAHNDYKSNVIIAQAHPEIDLVVSGHSHVLTPDQKVSGVNLVVEAGEFGEQIGVVNMVYDVRQRKMNSVESTFWPVGEENQLADPTIAVMVGAAYQKWAPEALQRIANSKSNFTLLNARNNYEGTLHDWVADTFCLKTHCDLALANREMLRETVHLGPITRERLYMAAPYDDQIVTFQMPRNKIITMLEASIKRGLGRDKIVPWALAGGEIKLNVARAEDASVESSNSDQKKSGEKLIDRLKKVSVILRTLKPLVKVALPGYVSRHCTDFFRSEDCPLPNVIEVGSLREALATRLESVKEVKAPAADRVQLIRDDLAL